MGKHQKSKPKRKRRRRPAEPLDEPNTTDDSLCPIALSAAKRRVQTVKPTESTSKLFKNNLMTWKIVIGEINIKSNFFLRLDIFLKISNNNPVLSSFLDDLNKSF